MEIAAVLQESDLFGGLTPRQASAVAAALHPRKLSKGTLLFEAGDPGFSMFLVAKGRIATQGHIVCSGDLFGEESLLSGAARPSDAVALEPSEVWSLERGDFERCIARSPAMALGIMAKLWARATRPSAVPTVRERLARLLMEVARSGSERMATGHLRFRNPYSRKEMAERIGARRESVSRELKRMAESGLLAVRGREFLVDEGMLARVSEPISV